MNLFAFLILFMQTDNIQWPFSSIPTIRGNFRSRVFSILIGHMCIDLQQRLDLPVPCYRLQHLRIHASLGSPGTVGAKIMNRMARYIMHNPQNVPAIQQVISIIDEDIFS